MYRLWLLIFLIKIKNKKAMILIYDIYDCILHMQSMNKYVDICISHEDLESLLL